jgi:hypothetical protein
MIHLRSKFLGDLCYYLLVRVPCSGVALYMQKRYLLILAVLIYKKIEVLGFCLIPPAIWALTSLGVCRKLMMVLHRLIIIAIGSLPFYDV